MTDSSVRAPERRSVYLDHAATTDMVPAAIDAMTAVLRTHGNASSLHGSGRAARRRIEEARESVAVDLGARPSEVIFTGGGTEGDNLAVKGIFLARRDTDPRRTRVIVSPIEHHAVLDAVEALERDEGATVEYLPVDAEGRVRSADLRAMLDDDAESVALVSVMWANNEVGSVAPIADLAAVAAEYGIPLHTDAVQAVAYRDIDFAASGAAAATLAAHKFGGPQGAGVLLVRRDVAVRPLVHGGGHERDIRSGTHDTASIVATAVALREAVRSRPDNLARTARLRARLVDGIAAIVEDAVVNGPEGDDVIDAIVNVSIPGCEGDSLLMLLDAAGIECSTGSACTAGVAGASHVLLAMGIDERTARGTLRISFGHTSTEADVDAFLAALPGVVERARAAGPAFVGSRSGGRS